MFKKFSSPRYVLLIIFAASLIAFVIDLPRTPIKFHYKNFNIDTEVGGYQLNLFNGLFYRDLEVKQGLDIAGGVSVVLKADMTKISEGDRKDALNSLKDVIEKRVNLLGISEANVATSQYKDDYRVIVELPGVTDTGKALDTVGKVAHLDFKLEEEQKNDESESAPEVALPSFKDTGLGGGDLRKASITFDPNSVTRSPQIQLLFNADGTKKFREITSANIGKRLAIYLDDDILVAPVINSAITDGVAVITGQFSLDAAKSLVAQLNAGALPVPVEVLEQKTIGPSLGKEAVVRNLAAGVLGLLLVITFMVLYYGRLGILASIALIIYGILTLALYKLIPVVLTLPGLAGFILSIGMAVDSNILIFERIKEELMLKRPLSVALENGFGRSWDSIRDANIATLSTAFILFNPFDFWFLPTSPLVRGFALTLALGIIMSLFTGVFVTRNLVRVFFRVKK